MNKLKSFGYGMKYNSKVICSALLVCLATFGCGPSAPASLALPDLQVKEVGKKVEGIGGAPSYIFVDDFIDARTETDIAKVDGKGVSLKEDQTGVSVRSGLRQALERKGFVFSDTAPIVLSGEIRQWKADVTGGFKSKIRSEASLKLEVLDPGNKRIYAAVYKGYSYFEGTSLGAEDIRKALGVSMEEAILQILKDPQLIKLLSSF